MKSVLSYAADENLAPRNVAENVRPPRAEYQETTHWTSAELVRFRQAADEDELAALWRLVVSGLRRSELLGLRWFDVDTDRGVVTIRQGRVTLGAQGQAVGAPKSKRSVRLVPVEALWPGSVAHLRALRAKQTADRLALGAWPDIGDLVAVNAAGQPVQHD